MEKRLQALVAFLIRVLKVEITGAKRYGKTSREFLMFFPLSWLQEEEEKICFMPLSHTPVGE